MQTVTGDGAPAEAALERPAVRGPVSRLRRLAVWRGRAARALLVLPVFIGLTVDAARRGPRILEFRGFYAATYAAAVVESILVWGILLYAASRRDGRWPKVLAVLFVVGETLSIGGQRYFHDQYHAYLNVDVSLFAS